MEELHTCIECAGVYSLDEIIEYKTKTRIFFYCKNCDDEIDASDTDYEPLSEDSSDTETEVDTESSDSSSSSSSSESDEETV